MRGKLRNEREIALWSGKGYMGNMSVTRGSSWGILAPFINQESEVGGDEGPDSQGRFRFSLTP